MNKKILATSLTVLSLGLSGCFSTDPTSPTPTATETSGQQSTYQSTAFNVIYPSAWDVIETKDFTSDIPPETVLVIRNNIKNDTFTSNVNIVKNSLQLTKSSMDYAKEVLNRQRTGLLDYKETKREVITLNVGGQAQETYYTEFEARLNQTDPILKFAQTYAVKDKSGFIIMGAWSQQENTAIVDLVIRSVKSFRVN